MSTILQTETTLDIVIEDFTLTCTYSGETNPNITFNATITVTDQDINALVGATVLLDGGTYTTDANGQISVDLIRGDYTAEASLDGHVPNSVNFTILDVNVADSIVLNTIGSFDSSFDESFE